MVPLRIYSLTHSLLIYVLIYLILPEYRPVPFPGRRSWRRQNLTLIVCVDFLFCLAQLEMKLFNSFWNNKLTYFGLLML